MSGLLEHVLEDLLEPVERTCVGCGCTDSHACPGGCGWATLAPPVCTGCVAEQARVEAAGFPFPVRPCPPRGFGQ